MKKNVAFIISSLSKGGAERVVSNLSLCLPSEFNIYILTAYDYEEKYPYNGKHINLNLNHIGFKTSQLNIFGKFISLIRKTKKLKKMKESLEIDVSVSFLEEYNFLNLFSRRKNEKIIISIRNNKSVNRSISDFYQKQLIRWFYNFADVIVPLSDGVKEDLAVNFGLDKTKMVRIYPFFNNQALTSFNDREIHGSLKGKRFILNVGRLHYQKGQKYLIKVFSFIKKEYPDLKLVILGKGELEEELIELLEQYQLKDSVFLLGFVENPEIYFEKAEFFVFSSLYEGFGNALIEAMSFGLPVISTDCDFGPKEILTSDYNGVVNEMTCSEFGIMVPSLKDSPFNPLNSLSRKEQELAKGIRLLLSDKKLRSKYSNLAKKRSLDFRKDKILNEWIEIF